MNRQRFWHRLLAFPHSEFHLAPQIQLRQKRLARSHSPLQAHMRKKSIPQWLLHDIRT